MSHAALKDLARAAGLQVDWRDASGHARTVSPDSLQAILAAMGLACASPHDIAESRDRLERDAREAGAYFLTAHPGALVRTGLPPGRARLTLENGSGIELDTHAHDGALGFRAPLAPGYHLVESGGASLTLAVAPPRAFTVADIVSGRRWGAAAQIYALRGRRQAPFGDFTTLAETAASLGRAGADALAISPVHAMFAADPGRASPYAPSTRLFLNVLFADPGGLDAEPSPQEPGGELIDWAAAGPARLARLRDAFGRFASQGSDADRCALQAFRREGGDDLERHARFEALHGRFLAETGAKGWQDWPARFHDPAGAAVAEFAQARTADVEFHVFLQWLADRGLCAAEAAAGDAGMGVGLIADLAVGMDAGGSHAWSRPHDLLGGVSVGAPPDVFQPAGQDWGLATFSPQALKRSRYQAFIATLRVAMKHAGGVRIDHAMGLRRLWLTPHGASPADGAYLSYPFEDMVRLIALESWRARAVVVGEDLGTVPDGFRDATTAAGIMGMRVLGFEREPDEGFIPPGRWSAAAMAMTGTHDLPTVAGWWRERDIDWMQRLGRQSRRTDLAEERGEREVDRDRLWRACREAGVAEGPQPSLDDAQAAVDAALAYVARSSCELAMIPLEDLLGLEEQPNLPGTIDEHPNWRRRLPADADALLADPRVAARIERLNRERPRPSPANEGAP